jgi:hypothetical protein
VCFLSLKAREIEAFKKLGEGEERWLACRFASEVSVDVFGERYWIVAWHSGLVLT